MKVSCFRVNWEDEPAAMEQEAIDGLNWEPCAAFGTLEKRSSPPGSGIQGCERALCAMELVFLNILHMAHESCASIGRFLG